MTAVVGTRHIDLPSALGADRVVNYETEDFTGLGQTFDLVFDAVGKTSFRKCRPLLAEDGVFSATDLGPGWSNIVLSLLYGATGSGRVRIPFPQDAPGFMQQLARLMSEGRFRGVFDRRVAFDEIADAFRYVETGQKTGIVVVDIS